MKNNYFNAQIKTRNHRPVDDYDARPDVIEQNLKTNKPVWRDETYWKMPATVQHIMDVENLYRPNRAQEFLKTMTLTNDRVFLF